MGKSYRGLSQAEIRQRQQQSQRDREQHRRQQQSQRDREQHRRQQQSQRDRGQHRRQQVSQQLGQVIMQPVHSWMNFQSSTHTASIFLPDSTNMAPKPLEKPAEDSVKGLESLFNNSKFSDVVLYLGASKSLFPAHRVVLSVRSPYFDDALQSKFKEGVLNEFVFEEDSPHALWRVLQYMYTGVYSDEPAECLNSDGDDLELLKHLRVYALADMFRMEDLKTVSWKKFKTQLQQHWISDTFPDCIREVYSISCDSSTIKETVVGIASSHKEELVRKRPFQELIREGGDFAVDLVLKMANSGTML